MATGRHIGSAQVAQPGYRETYEANLERTLSSYRTSTSTLPLNRVGPGDTYGRASSNNGRLPEFPTVAERVTRLGEDGSGFKSNASPSKLNSAAPMGSPYLGGSSSRSQSTPRPSSTRSTMPTAPVASHVASKPVRTGLSSILDSLRTPTLQNSRASSSSARSLAQRPARFAGSATYNDLTPATDPSSRPTPHSTAQKAAAPGRVMSPFSSYAQGAAGSSAYNTGTAAYPAAGQSRPPLGVLSQEPRLPLSSSSAAGGYERAGGSLGSLGSAGYSAGHGFQRSDSSLSNPQERVSSGSGAGASLMAERSGGAYSLLTAPQPLVAPTNLAPINTQRTTSQDSMLMSSQNQQQHTYMSSRLGPNSSMTSSPHPTSSGPSALPAHMMEAKQYASSPQAGSVATASSQPSLQSSLSLTQTCSNASSLGSALSYPQPLTANATTTSQPKAATTLYKQLRHPSFPTLQSCLRDASSGAGCVGLQNLGNTCFMNSILQSVNAVPELAAVFLQERPWSSKALVAPAYADLVASMWRASYASVVNPSAFLRKISKYDSRWGDGSQQDSQEFLHSLLEALQSECNRVVGKPQYRQLEGKGSEEQQAEEADSYARSWHDSMIDDIFGGQLQSTIQCQACGRQSHCFDPFLDLAVPIPSSKGGVSVQDCLQAFVEVEKLDGNECYKCEHCKKCQPHTKRLQIYRFPRVLVLTLKRFSSRSQAASIFSRFRSASKNNTSVALECDSLDLSPFCNLGGLRNQMSSIKGLQPVYQLIAISHHSGSLEGGHYTATARSANDGAWYHFNDTSVRRESKPSGASSSAYVLFYRLVHPPSSL